MPPAPYLGHAMEISQQYMTQLNDTITQLMQKWPHLQPILHAFAPFLYLKHRLLKEKLFQTASQIKIHTASLNQGTPLIQENPPQISEEVFNELARLLLTAMKEGFPSISNELDSLANELTDGRMKMGDLLSLQSNAVSNPAVKNAIGIQVLQLFTAMLQNLILTQWRAEVFATPTALNWSRGTCPVCGNLPVLSVSRGKGRPWLYCGTCGQEWQFPWAKCPACGQEQHSEAPYFFIEGEKDEKAFVCRNCNRYLLSVRRYEDEGSLNLDLLAMSLIHLDILMQQQGLLPMNFCLWNDFRGALKSA